MPKPFAVLALCLAASLAATLPVAAQTGASPVPSIAGFKRTDEANGQVTFQRDIDGGRMLFIVGAPSPAQGRMEDFLRSAAQKLAAGNGLAANALDLRDWKDYFTCNFALSSQTETIFVRMYAFDEGGQRQLMVVTFPGQANYDPSKEEMEKQAFNLAMGHTLNKRGAAGSGGGNSGSASPAPSGGKLTQFMPNWTRPGAGMGDKAVQAIIYQFHYVPAHARSELDTYLLLKNGKVLFNAIYSPRDFDEKACAGNISCGTWKRASGGIALSWPNASGETIAAPAEAAPTPANYRFAGSYMARFSRMTQEYDFRADGTFTRHGGDSDKGSGTYRIEGFTIELTYADARRERHLFGVYTKTGAKPQQFQLGEQLMVPK